jgi:hypothetical protein
VEDRIPASPLSPYSDIGRPSIDRELMMGCSSSATATHSFGAQTAQEVGLHLAYRWFCKLDLDDEIPQHSTFSANRLGRFSESDLLRHIFERKVWSTMAMGLVSDHAIRYFASVLNCRVCPLKPKCCPNIAARRIARDVIGAALIGLHVARITQRADRETCPVSSARKSN